ncbi:MAG: hypothetical protein IT386_06410 [Deltaproteobacteria bacterium]|nr:hypothetical protein [Deltaproteobacteria bacterium]
MRQCRRRPRAIPSLVFAVALSSAGGCAATAGDGGSSGGREASPSAATQAPASIDDALFERLVEETETARGQRFLRPPALAWADAGDAALAPLERERLELPLLRSAPGFFQLRTVDTAFADRERDRIVAIPPGDVSDLRVALASLLDAQLYPDLVRDAALLPGDPGLAQRGMLAASARATADGGLGPVPSGPRMDPFSEAVLRVTHPVGTSTSLVTPIFAATEFLQGFSDREAPFRRPPLSTFEILVPGAWERAEPPVLLIGPEPRLGSCTVAGDESLGVFRLGVALIERGGSVPGVALGEWRGDRLVTWRCADGSAPWLYVAELGSDRGAEALRDAAEALLPASLARPLAASAHDRRAIVSHGVPEAAQREFVAALRGEPLRSASQILPLR